MEPLLRFSTAVDDFNRRAGYIATWMVLLACLVSAGNAMLRYSMRFLVQIQFEPLQAALRFWARNSNAFLEIQWQMFSGIFLLGAAYVFKLNEHVRVDLVYGSVSPRGKLWIDVFGIIFFFFPAAVVLCYLAWPFAVASFQSGEYSSNAGGLILWPVKLLLPVGFCLLILQGVSELIKRCAALRGEIAYEIAYEKPLQ